MYFELIIVLLKITFANLIYLKNKRRINNYYSEIKLVIEISDYISPGHVKEAYILNDRFSPEPFEVKVNGNTKPNCKKTCYFQKGINYVTLKFEDHIKTCESMFSDVEGIIEVDLSEFDASRVVNMSYMFADCSDLKKINFGNVNISSVENMKGLFYGCSSLTSIDLSNIDTSNIKALDGMFFECSSIEKIDFGNINI